MTGAVMPPIFTSSTYAQLRPASTRGLSTGAPTTQRAFALERMVARLEGSKLIESRTCRSADLRLRVVSRQCICDLLTAGDEVVCMDDVYGGTNRQFSKVKARSQGLKVTYVDLSDLRNRPGDGPATKLVWVETPTNPTLKVYDLSAVGRVTEEQARTRSSSATTRSLADQSAAAGIRV